MSMSMSMSLRGHVNVIQVLLFSHSASSFSETVSSTRISSPMFCDFTELLLVRVWSTLVWVGKCSYTYFYLKASNLGRIFGATPFLVWSNSEKPFWVRCLPLLRLPFVTRIQGFHSVESLPFCCLSWLDPFSGCFDDWLLLEAHKLSK